MRNKIDKSRPNDGFFYGINSVFSESIPFYFLYFWHYNFDFASELADFTIIQNVSFCNPAGSYDTNLELSVAVNSSFFEWVNWLSTSSVIFGSLCKNINCDMTYVSSILL